MNYKITPQKFAVAVIQNVTLTPTPPYKQELNGLCHISRHFHEAQMSYLLSVLSQFQLLCTQFVQNACSQHSTQIGYILKSHCSTYLSSNFYVPNLCRMLVDSILHRLGTFKSHCSNYLCCNFYVPNLCRMLVVSILHRLGTGDNFKNCQNHFQSKIYPICVESLHIGICKHSTQIGYTKFFGIF